MALTLRHWILAALLGCGATAVAFLPPSPPRHEPWAEIEAFANQWYLTPERARADRLENYLIAAKTALAITLRRDSLANAIHVRAYRPGASPTLRFDQRWTAPSWMRRAIQTSFDSVWRRVDPKSADVSLTVIIDSRNFDSRYFDPYATYFLPPATDGRTCVAAIQPGWQVTRFLQDSTPPTESLPLQPWLQSAFGPCAFYAAFGQPGKNIENWLLDRQFDLASESDWNAPDQGVDSVLMERASNWRTSFDGIACASGDRTRCRAALLTPVDVTGGRDTRKNLRGVVSPPWYWELNLPGAERYLSDLVRTMGAERFGSFWRSPAAVDSAFSNAFGVPLETYTQRWARGHMRRFHATPALRLSTVLLSTAFAGVMLTGLCLYSVRRQVG